MTSTQPGRVARCRDGHVEPTTAKARTKCSHLLNADEARARGVAEGTRCARPANVVRAEAPAAAELDGAEDGASLEQRWAAEGPPAPWWELLGDESGDDPCDEEACGGCQAPRYTGAHTGTICPDCGPDCWDISVALALRAREHLEAVRAHAARTATASVAMPQAELDAQARQLAIRKGKIRRAFEQLLADDRLTAESRDMLEWYVDEVGKAQTAARLDELAEQAKGEKIRRRHWWQGEPAALTAGEDDDDYDDDEDQGDAADWEEEDDQATAPVLAIAASIPAPQHRAPPQRMTWADALAMRGWRLTPTIGSCQIIDEQERSCAAPTAGSPPITDGHGDRGWLCAGHYTALGATISEHNRRRFG